MGNNPYRTTKDGSVPSFPFWSSHAPSIEDVHEDDCRRIRS
jgi:hypothetical protein